MALTSGKLWKIVLSIVAVFIALVLSALAWCGCLALCMDLNSNTKGALIGFLELMVPYLIVAVYFQINKKLGVVTAVFLLLLQIGLVLDMLLNVSMSEMNEIGYGEGVTISCGICVLGCVIGFAYWLKLRIQTRSHKRKERMSFLLRVDDTYEIKGRGPIITGIVETGKVTSGDKLMIKGDGKTFNATVVTIARGRQQIKSANTGEDVGLLLRGVNYADLHKGQVVMHR